MKLILLTTCSIVLTLFGFAQVPDKMSYQAVIRDSNNSLLANTDVGMRISILNASQVVVYSETQTPHTNQNGLVSIQFGGAGLFNITWGYDGPYFLKTETDPTGGNNYTITGQSQLLTVPYAYMAQNSLHSSACCAFYASGNGPLGIAAGSSTSSLFPSVWFDDGLHFSNGVYTAIENGYYHFDAEVPWTTGADLCENTSSNCSFEIRTILMLNSIEVKTVESIVNAGVMVNVSPEQWSLSIDGSHHAISMAMYLSAGDHVSIKCENSCSYSPMTLNVEGERHFSGHKIY